MSQPLARGKGSSRRGQTLIELTAATTLLAVTLVPALRIMRDSLKVSREVETAGLLANYCVDKLELYLALTSAQWQPTTVTGDFAADGYPNIRFQVVRSESATDGGIPGSLMSITSTVWDDRNQNSTLDTSEPQVQFAGKIARVVSYEYEAQGK